MGGTFPRGSTAITGLATYGVGEAPGHTSLELAAKASMLAIADAGLRLGDVDGLFICLPDDFFAGLSLAEYLGLQPRFTDNNRTGGSAFMSHMATAALALSAGYIDVALIAYDSNQRTAGGKLSTPFKNNVWEAPYRPLFPISSYALAAARHMHEYGTTRAQLAEVAVAARGWANGNPEAFAKGPLTIEDCLESRVISSPLSVKDCCIVTAGAAAIVMTRADRASPGDRPPVPVLGAAAATWWNAISQADDVTTTAAAESGTRAYAMAGVGPSDIAVVQLYAALPFPTIPFLGDLGFFPRVEGGRFVSDGRSAQGGQVPVTTTGGGRPCCH